MLHTAQQALRVASLVIAVAACSTSGRGTSRSSPDDPISIRSDDPAVTSTIESFANLGVDRIARYFGRPWRDPILVRVFADRASFDAYLGAAWGLTRTQCWMVGGAETRSFVLLSPRSWAEEACDHDAGDADHVRDLVVHELVHSYHMQHNPSDEFAGVDDLDWFVEGLATLASGQYDRFHRDRVREAVAENALPVDLADAWTGQYRYAIAGSLVAFIEDRHGRRTVVELLAATSEDELLTALGTNEVEFLSGWRAWLGAE